MSLIQPVSQIRQYLYPASYFVALDRPDQPIRPDQTPRSVAEQKPLVPTWNEHHPDLALDPQFEPALGELMPFMNALWDHFREVSLARELLWRLTNRRRMLAANQAFHRRIDQNLQDYVLSMLLERALLNAVARRRIFIFLWQNDQGSPGPWSEQTVAARREVISQWPSLFQTRLTNPFTFNVNRPLMVEASDLQHIAAWQQPSLIAAATQLTSRQTPKLLAYLGPSLATQLQRLGEPFQQQDWGQLRHELNQISESFPRQWRQAWEQNGFKQLIADQIRVRLPYLAAIDPSLPTATRQQHAAEIDRTRLQDSLIRDQIQAWNSGSAYSAPTPPPADIATRNVTAGLRQEQQQGKRLSTSPFDPAADEPPPSIRQARQAPPADHSSHADQATITEHAKPESHLGHDIFRILAASDWMAVNQLTAMQGMRQPALDSSPDEDHGIKPAKRVTKTPKIS
jgi:hypothetical protein